MEKLSIEEARILGSLLEKSLATPDYYPLTLNSLRLACNQKSNRTPVSDYDEDTISLALAGLKQKCLVTFSAYGSQGQQYKYRHFLLDSRYNLRDSHIALLSVLLLRGSQTLNELKTRTSNLHDFASLEDIEITMQKWAEREEPWVEKLEKRSGWKEPRWKQLLLDIEEPENQSSASLTEEATASGKSKWDEFSTLQIEVQSLKQELSALQNLVHKMHTELYGSAQ